MPADSAGDEPRPTALDPQQLGFTPRPPVPWLSPVLLAGTAVRVVLSELFGAYLDKRELQNALPRKLFDERPETGDATGDEVWLDYVADLGDGFDSTYAIAYLLAQPCLTVDGHELPRGRAVVMGGAADFIRKNLRQVLRSHFEALSKGHWPYTLPFFLARDRKKHVVFV